MREADVDVAIVGGGPAGIASALSLRRGGVGRITILEREEEAGGVPRHCGHPPFGMREFNRILTGPAYAARLRDSAKQTGIDIRTRTDVVRLRPSGVLSIANEGGVSDLRAARVILATGVRESSRAARFISGDRPVGVMTTGTLQQSIHLEKLTPFRRPVIVGTELVSLSAVLTCRKAGIRPVAVVENGLRATARHPLDLFPRLLGIPMHYGVEIVDIVGKGRVEAVAIRFADGSRRVVACDGVLLTGRFVPEASLVQDGHLAFDAGSGGPSVDQFGRCSDPTYFAAGNLLRPVETAGWSFREGLRIGAMVAADLRGDLPAAKRTIPITRGRGIKFVMPQRLALPRFAGSLDQIQLRAETAATGCLVVSAGDAVLWKRRMPLLPERRLLIPLAALSGAAEDAEAISVDFHEDGEA